MQSTSFEFTTTLFKGRLRCTRNENQMEYLQLRRSQNMTSEERETEFIRLLTQPTKLCCKCFLRRIKELIARDVML